MLQHKGQDNIPPRNTVPFAQRASSPDTMATIYRPARSAMTSANTRRWKLRFEPRTAPFVDPLMGWIGGTDTLSQIELDFPSAEAAVAYAKRQGLNFIVQGPAEKTQLLPDDAMDIGICIRPCCRAERVGERHCHRSNGDRSAHETRRVGRNGSISYSGCGF